MAFRSSRNASNLSKTQLCNEYVRRGECKRKQCFFAHTLSELEQAPTCLFGDRCKTLFRGKGDDYPCLCIHSRDTSETRFRQRTGLDFDAARDARLDMVWTNQREQWLQFRGNNFIAQLRECDRISKTMKKIPSTPPCSPRGCSRSEWRVRVAPVPRKDESEVVILL